MAWAAIRSCIPAFRTLPWITRSAPRRWPTSRISSDTPLNWKADELESRGPRNHVQSRNACECVDDFLTDPVTKIVLLRLRTHIRKRQHGNRRTASFLPVFLWPSFQPAEDRDVTARPQSNQDGIAPTGPFLVICFHLGSETTSLDTYNRIDVRIVIGGAIEDVHGDRKLLEAVEISIEGPIHNVGQKPGEPG